MTKTTRYKDGQILSYAEYGDKRGYPILIQHGLIASIRDYHLFDALINAGARVICIARPGYGESSPYRMRNIAEWGELISVLVDELEIAQFDVLGMSSGAPYSYAIGSRLPDSVRNIFIFSGTPALFDAAVLALWPYPANKDASIGELEEIAGNLFFSGLTREDLKRSDVRDSMMHNCFGIAQDLKLRCVDWGFALTEITSPVHMQHSETDEAVPAAAAKLTAAMLPNCRLELRQSGGHFSAEELDSFIRTTMLPHYGGERA